METPSSQQSSHNQGGADGRQSEGSLTPSSSNSQHADLPTLEAVLTTILVEQLEKSEEYVAAAVSSFKEEDVTNVSLLLALLENSKANSAGLDTLSEFKKCILVENRKLSTVFWVLLEKHG